MKLLLIMLLSVFFACAQELKEFEQKAKTQVNGDNRTIETGESQKVMGEVGSGDSRRSLKKRDQSEMSPLSQERTSLPSIRINLGVFNLGPNVVYFDRVGENDLDVPVDAGEGEASSKRVTYGIAEMKVNGTLKKFSLKQKIKGYEQSDCSTGYCLDFDWFYERSEKYVKIPSEFIALSVVPENNKNKADATAKIIAINEIPEGGKSLALEITGMGVLTEGQLICADEKANRCPKKMEVGAEFAVQYNGILPPQSAEEAAKFKIHTP